MESIELLGQYLEGFPLFIRKIFYNNITSSSEEMKLIRYNKDIQANKIRSPFSARRISKTVNTNIFEFNEYTNEKQ